MIRMILKDKSMTSYSDIVGFQNDREALWSSKSSVSLMSGCEEISRFHHYRYKINGQDYANEKDELSFDDVYLSTNQDVEVIIKQISIDFLGFIRISSIGYVNGKRCFVARPEGLLGDKMYFCCVDGMSNFNAEGGDFVNSIALLCWWRMYEYTNIG